MHWVNSLWIDSAPEISPLTPFMICLRERIRHHRCSLSFSSVSVRMRCFRSSYSMVLVLNGVLQEECPPDTRSLYLAHPIYRETANQLLSIGNKVVGPAGLLYVQQRELAATVPHDSKFSVLWFSILSPFRCSFTPWLRKPWTSRTERLISIWEIYDFWANIRFFSWEEWNFCLESINLHTNSDFPYRVLFFLLENVSILGSDDATTCIIVVVRHSGEYF